MDVGCCLMELMDTQRSRKVPASLRRSGQAERERYSSLHCLAMRARREILRFAQDDTALVDSAKAKAKDLTPEGVGTA